jgi:ATP-binding cassette subfamily B protein
MPTAERKHGGFASLLRMAAQHKGKMALAVVFSLAAQLCAIAPFLILCLLAGRIAGQQAGAVEPAQVWPLALAAGACVLLRYAFTGVSSLLAHLSAFAVLHDLRLSIAEALPRLPLGFFNAGTSGQIRKVMLEDVEQMEIFIGHNLPELLGSLLSLLLSAGVLFWVDWRLALASFCLLPVGFLAQALTISRNRDTRARYFTANEKTNAAMVQYIQGMPVIKAFSRTEESFRTYADSVAECARHEAEMCRRWSVPMAVFSVALGANMLVLLPVGAGLYLAGGVSFATLFLFLLMGLGLGSALQQFMTLGSFLENQAEGRKRIDALLAREPLPEAPAPKQPADNALALRDVDFAYGDKQVLFGVSARLEPGRFLALVGPSGAGKSTLARLVPRFWDVTGGAIAVGGRDIRDMALDTLMDRMTFVFQDVFLFNDTIEANLRIGRPDATFEELEAAARAARCHEFIASLPDGYRHVVGERGGVVSGGEKQRICIARALLKDAPILVLDEATAFIDPENEADIQKALSALARNKTLVVIAHRLSTITAADEILVVDRGRVAARGTHEHLLRESALYARLWQAHTASRNWALGPGGAARCRA